MPLLYQYLMLRRVKIYIFTVLKKNLQGIFCYLYCIDFPCLEELKYTFCNTVKHKSRRTKIVPGRGGGELGF